MLYSLLAQPDKFRNLLYLIYPYFFALLYKELQLIHVFEHVRLCLAFSNLVNTVGF